MMAYNLTSPRSGRPVANQYEIEDKGTVYFQSYRTLIAKKTGATYTISSNWDYSRTTAKYFYEWLRGYGFNEYEIDELKKWLRKPSRKHGDRINDFVNQTIEYVEEL